MVDSLADSSGPSEQKESLRRLILQENRHYRELERIRSSLAFRLGASIVRSLKFPPKLLILPFTLLYIGFDWGLGRIGKKKYQSNGSIHLAPPNTSCIVMFPTNGVGFGHFTRLLSVAKRLKRKDPSLEIVFFTTMSTIHLLKEHGIIGYRIPGRKEYSDKSSTSWNAVVEETLSLVFSLHRPSTFIFDGAFPYRGMLNTIKEREHLEKIWVRRGTFKKKATSIPEDSLLHFDHIIRPQDSVRSDLSKEILYDLEVSHCQPIVLLDSDDLLTKNEARSRLGIQKNYVVVYIQLGAGNINNIHSTINKCLSILSTKTNIRVVIGESMIGDRIPIDGERIQLLRDYPNSMYFNGFDFGIIAGGYNSYHEAIYHSFPCVCIPNPKTGMDDQIARVKVAGDSGAMLVIEDPSLENLTNSINKMLDPVNRDKMIQSMESLKLGNGAEEVAEYLIDHNSRR
jgi:UDP:flavonoid glycosyltransferase YjiC (YdhE family)